MDNLRIIEVKRSVFEENDKDAERLRKELKERGIFLFKPYVFSR